MGVGGCAVGDCVEVEEDAAGNVGREVGGVAGAVVRVVGQEPGC